MAAEAAQPRSLPSLFPCARSSVTIVCLWSCNCLSIIKSPMKASVASLLLAFMLAQLGIFKDTLLIQVGPDALRQLFANPEQSHPDRVDGFCESARDRLDLFAIAITSLNEFLVRIT
jgi:hypothetical protein